MDMQRNMADMLRAKRALSGQSIGEWADELGIAPSTLQDYLKGSGNPTLRMVDHLAEKLGIDPLSLIAGEIEPELYKPVLLMVGTIQAVSRLPQPKRIRFAELFMEQMRLLEGDDA